MSLPAQSPQPGGFRHQSVAVGGRVIHTVEKGSPHGQPFLLLHGWPESWRTWRPLMALAPEHARMIAIDLPGVGESAGPSDGSKLGLAAIVHEFVSVLGLSDLTLVGHDIGGMVGYAYLRAYPGAGHGVIMDIVLPGVDPWEEFLRQPFLWHFAFHALPELPEYLVQGRQQAYFDYFYEILAAQPGKLTAAARRDYVAAYASPAALAAAFDWYRAFPRDAADNQRLSQGPPLRTPLLYLRGEKERGGDIGAYADGLRRAGAGRLDVATIPGAGHFPQEEAPEALWPLIASFVQQK